MKKHIYQVRYSGLSEGTHEYDYHLSGDFFRLFDESDVLEGDLNVKITIKKDSDRLLELYFDIQGWVQIQCDRCLDYFNHPVQISEILFIKLGKEYSEESEDVIVWPENNPYIDLAPHIHDYIELSLPYQRIHPLDENGNSTCNMQMIEKLNEYLIIEEKPETDPRWDQLRKLLN